MAGGKETPRQKMIGMMYLVLTALLALNVSKTILDAFVAIEDNIQISNENEVLRGEEKKAELKEVSEESTEPEVRKKAQDLMKTIAQIDRMTAARIKNIDGLKLQILKECGEDVANVGKTDQIIYEKFKDPLKPMRMKLEFVEGKDKYDEPMRILIGEDITRPNNTGTKLWNDYLGYRNQLTELLASSNHAEGQKFFFKAPDIRKFKNQNDLSAQIDKAISSSNVNQDDKEAIKKIYASLSKQERSTVNDVKNVHWIGKTFDHTPSVAAIASLSSLQKEILTARADAISLVRLRVGGGEYSFNKIMALVYGPDVINQGEEAELQVLMAAYDSDKNPKIMVSGGNLRETKSGKGYVTVKGSGNEMKLNGTITILNKSGVPRTMPWEKTIRVMKPSGSVSLPAYNVLYRNYPNEIAGTASGYEETILSGGAGLSLSKSGQNYMGKISSPGRTTTITIKGKNKGTGKTEILGTYNFRVMNLPPPTGYLGTLASGTASKSAVNSMGSVFTKYDASILLNAKFDVVNWELKVGSMPPTYGNGNLLSAPAKSQLRQAKPGDIVSLIIKYKGPVSGFTSVAIKVI